MSITRGRPRTIRATTISLSRSSAADVKMARLNLDASRGEDLPELPLTRAHCDPGGAGPNAARPCPFVSCQFHLYLDVNENGSIKLNFPDVDPERLAAMPETCALDVADQGGKTLEEVGVLTNLTRERVRQIEEQAMARLRPSARELI